MFRRKRDRVEFSRLLVKIWTRPNSTRWAAGLNSVRGIPKKNWQHSLSTLSLWERATREARRVRVSILDAIYGSLRCRNEGVSTTVSAPRGIDRAPQYP